MAMVLSAWALVEDWEAVDRSPYSIGKVLAGEKFPFARQGGTDYHWLHGVDFLTALKDVQRCLEELELCILELEQQLHGLKELNVSDSETELYLFQTTGPGPHLLMRPAVQQKNGAKKVRPQEALGTKEAKEKRNGTNSAARVKPRKVSKEQSHWRERRNVKGKVKPQWQV